MGGQITWKNVAKNAEKAQAQVDIFEAAEMPKPEQISIIGGD